ncbi:hypothetical protein [Brazilian marseillevirus]|uniref:hypothetical protein n=1 Tax=Brazilian marseillevirus TaxID=1813599 RepID=UPI0007819602|nr:hypothetical protein A3303_gp140 [Brazilian marseillevirus]AMQ10648.1 hypothetical protein [Brazilian marseillevirus]
MILRLSVKDGLIGTMTKLLPNGKRRADKNIRNIFIAFKKMMDFLGRRECISFSLASSLKVSPETFVQTRSLPSGNMVEWCDVHGHFLPDGTRHGKYSKEWRKGSWKSKILANYSLGRLDGSFFASSKDGVFTTLELEGIFDDGFPMSSLKCYRKLGKMTEMYRYEFQNGLPTFFEKEYVLPSERDSSRVRIVWKGTKLEIGGHKFTDVFISGEEPAEHRSYDKLFPFYDKELKSVSLFDELGCAKVYGTNKRTWKKTRICLPVFTKI